MALKKGPSWEATSRKGKNVRVNSAMLLAALFTVGHAILFIAYLIEVLKHTK